PSLASAIACSSCRCAMIPDDVTASRSSVLSTGFAADAVIAPARSAMVADPAANATRGFMLSPRDRDNRLVGRYAGDHACGSVSNRAVTLTCSRRDATRAQTWPTIDRSHSRSLMTVTYT